MSDWLTDILALSAVCMNVSEMSMWHRPVKMKCSDFGLVIAAAETRKLSVNPLKVM